MDCRLAESEIRCIGFPKLSQGEEKEEEAEEKEETESDESVTCSGERSRMGMGETRMHLALEPTLYIVCLTDLGFLAGGTNSVAFDSSNSHLCRHM